MGRAQDGPIRWRNLHKLTYPAAILAVVHYIWLVEGWPLDPFVYLAVVIGLIAMRMIPRRKPSPARLSRDSPPDPVEKSEKHARVGAKFSPTRGIGPLPGQDSSESLIRSCPDRPIHP